MLLNLHSSRRCHRLQAVLASRLAHVSSGFGAKNVLMPATIPSTSTPFPFQRHFLAKPWHFDEFSMPKTIQKMLNYATSALLFAGRFDTKAKSSQPARHTKPAENGRELDEDDEEEERKAGRRKRQSREDEEKKNRPEPTLTDLIELLKKYAQEMRPDPEQLLKKLAEKGSLSKQAVWEVRKESRVKLLKSMREPMHVLEVELFGKQKAAKLRKMVDKRIKRMEEMEYSTYLKKRRRRRMLFNTFLVLLFLYYITKSIIAWNALDKPVKPIEKPIAVDNTFNPWYLNSNVVEDMPDKRGAPAK